MHPCVVHVVWKHTALSTYRGVRKSTKMTLPLNWIVLFTVVNQATTSGIFELQLLSFDNEAGKDDYGKCCNGRRTSGTAIQSGDCEGSCRPRFLVCLKEYQATIDTLSPCTFGQFVTPAQGPGSGNDTLQDGFATPIGIQFPFTWPHTFSLIVEAWHGNLSSGVLISRLSMQRYLDVKQDWTEDTHQTKYSTLRFQYRVTCDAHYYGRGCENLCRPRDDQFGHYTCSPMGDRVCLTGWQDNYCTKPRCAPGCDELHGSCTKPNECKCSTGWEGQLCTECQRYPGCMHGSCMRPWDCICNEGWGGLFCNQDLNFCTNHKPCRNGGTCFNTGQGSYTCQCLPGYTGKECETSVNDCTKVPCQNGGTCNATISTGNMSQHSKCECSNGYMGAHCEILVRTCAMDRHRCQNGATCHDSPTGYSCSCSQGYAGKHCTETVNECSPNPCLNGGTCLNGNGTDMTVQCQCTTGFTGDRCQTNIDDCEDQPCLNGATCLDLVNEFRCQCVPGYVGLLCQKKVNYCLAKPCANGGKCMQLTNDYMCKCADGFTGKDCSVEVDECNSQPCQHGGTCFNRVHTFECECPPGYVGRVCDESVIVPSPSVAPSARVSSDSNLSTEHVVVIATISTFVPLLVLVAVGAIICLKQRRKREKARADEEARLQNEQNTAHSSYSKRSAAIVADAHMIKNSWGKCTNNVVVSARTPSSPDDCSTASNVSVTVSDHEVFGSGVPKVVALTGQPHVHTHSLTPHQVIDGRSFYSIPRSRSQKQLNVEPGTNRMSQHQQQQQQQSGPPPDYDHLKRLSVMSNSSSAAMLCGGGGGISVGMNADGSSDPLMKQRPPCTFQDKDHNGSVYVIEEHYHHRPEALTSSSTSGLFATEV